MATWNDARRIAERLEKAEESTGVVTTVQQLSFALGVAVIGGVFAVSLGPDPVVAKYGEAFVHALAWNIGLLALTFVAAFALPRRQRVVGRGGNQIRARLNN
jgi:hypothetical protein